MAKPQRYRNVLKRVLEVLPTQTTAPDLKAASAPDYISRRKSDGIGKSGMPGLGPRPFRNWRSWNT